MASQTRPYGRAFLDSGVLIAAAARETGREVALDVLQLAQSGEVELFVSAVALVECRRGARGNERVTEPPPGVQAKLEAILANPRIILVEIDRLVALSARQLGLREHLRTWDAIHLAAALTVEADVMFTYDSSDFKTPRIIDGIWCGEPYVTSPTLLSVRP